MLIAWTSRKKFQIHFLEMISLQNHCLTFLPRTPLPYPSPHGDYRDLLSLYVQLVATSWTVARKALCSWNSPGKNTGVGSQSLLQGILPTQGSNLGLLHYRQILYHLSHQESQLCPYMTPHHHLEITRALRGSPSTSHSWLINPRKIPYPSQFTGPSV